jgi:hypothetical protein
MPLDQQQEQRKRFLMMVEHCEEISRVALRQVL